MPFKTTPCLVSTLHCNRRMLSLAHAVIKRVLNSLLYFTTAPSTFNTTPECIKTPWSSYFAPGCIHTAWFPVNFSHHFLDILQVEIILHLWETSSLAEDARYSRIASDQLWSLLLYWKAVSKLLLSVSCLRRFTREISLPEKSFQAFYLARYERLGMRLVSVRLLAPPPWIRPCLDVNTMFVCPTSVSDHSTEGLPSSQTQITSSQLINITLIASALLNLSAALPRPHV